MSPGVNKNKPPSPHAMECLNRAMRQPYPAQEVNFTVRDKLMQFEYAKLEGRQSPYKTHKAGKMVDYLVCTEKGAAAVAMTTTPSFKPKDDDWKNTRRYRK